jgi:hypothetical protein
MWPFGSPHGPRPLFKDIAYHPHTRMRRTQIAIQAHRRCADDPRRGWTLLGAKSRGFGLGGLGTLHFIVPNGVSERPRPGPPPTQTRHVPHRSAMPRDQVLRKDERAMSAARGRPVPPPPPHRSATPSQPRRPADPCLLGGWANFSKPEIWHTGVIHVY